MSNKEDLPSINDYLEDGELPSYKDFIEEEKELPSVEDYKTHIEEETIEDANGNSFAEIIDVVKAPEWQELVRLVNDVRKEIPEIPEIKSYDEEIGQISEKIAEIQENFSIYDLKSDKIYDLKSKNDEFEAKLTDIEQKITEVPEVRYYEGDIDLIYGKISRIKEEIESLPEVKYYENDLDALKSRIEQVNESIPTFPDWVQKVNEVPDFSWIGKTFGIIDDDFKKVQGHLDIIKEKIDLRVSELNENIEIKDFEQKVDLDNFKKNYSDSKDNIYKELKEITLRIYDHKHEFKDDDRKLKKAILGEQNKIKQTLEKQIKKFTDDSVKTDKVILSYFEELKEDIQEKVNSIPEVKYYDEQIDDLQSDVKSVKTDIKSLVSELHKIAVVIKKQQKTLSETDLTTGKKAEKLMEGLLNEPPNTKERSGGRLDPLTPLDQKFATLEDLSNHYRLFINRVQTQLSTMGGGGAGFIKDLDDVTFDQTTGTNKLLIYDGAKWVGIASTAVGGPADELSENTTGVNLVLSGNLSVAGIATYEDVKNIDSIGIVTARSGVDVLSGGINVTGISTFNTGVGTVHIGSGNTALLVDGDARILGILTVGSASVVIDGDNNTVSVGLVTVTNSTIILGENVTLDAGATGINSAPNVFYVAKDGDDANNGTSIDNAKLTIAGAVGVANTGSVIKVMSGNYVENNPIELPAFSAIVGDDLRTVKVLPNFANQDLFHVNKACKISNMTFSGHVHPAAAVAFPPNGASNVGGGKWKGPYIQNCTSDTTSGVGLRVDGRLAPKTKSMNVDAFTQYNQGGVGIAVTNEGYAQLVSVFTICCDSSIQCHAGGQVDLTNSNSSFGTFGIIANGKSVEKYVGVVTSNADVGQDNIVVRIEQDPRTINGFVYTPSTGIATITTSDAHGFIPGSDVRLADIILSCTDGNKIYPDKDFIYTVRSVDTPTSFTFNAGIHTQTHTYVSGGTAKIEAVRPYDGQVVFFDELFRSVESITITEGGTNYTSTPQVTISAPTGPNGETATAFATLEDGVVTSIDIISSGSQYRQTDNVTVTLTAPDSGTTAQAQAVMEDTYYTINSSTPPTVAGITTLTLAENLLNSVGVGSTAFFYQQSKVVASSHTFEYIGSGNTITSATPKRGGVTIQENEVVSTGGGRVIYTSTDQAGNFRIGDDLQINQATGTISGRAFSKSLFSEMTPFILALS